MKAPGFMVWNPDRDPPRCVHATLESAVTEAERLTRLNRGQRYFVMMPLLGGPEVLHAKSWSNGVRDGLAQAHREIMHAEARTDRLLDEVQSLKQRARRTMPVVAHIRAFQSIVADCLTWFAGFDAAHQHADSPPWTPDRAQLRKLNGVLLDIDAEISGSAHDSEEIPF